VARDAEQVRAELETQREGLTADVEDLREEGSKLKSRLPVVIGGAAAAFLALRAVKRLLRR
jgi:hypothetical protein